MKTFLCGFWQREEGAEVVEWVIVAAVLISIAAASYVLLGGSINGAVNDVGEEVKTAVGYEEPEEDET